jgi:hypothetical protein
MENVMIDDELEEVEQELNRAAMNYRGILMEGDMVEVAAAQNRVLAAAVRRAELQAELKERF